MHKLFGKLFYVCYRYSIKIKARIFSAMVAGAFAEFGENSILVPPIRLQRVERIKIGSRVYIGTNSWLQTLPDKDNQSPSISIGDGTSMAGLSVISAVRNVTIEENVLIARNLYISDHIHKYTDTDLPIIDQGTDKISPVLIRRGAWIGQNVVICPGVTIGIGAVIGANSVVNQNIPDYSVAAGAPARVIKTFGKDAGRL